MEERSIDELRAIAKAMKITKTTRMTAQEIIYKILDYQAGEASRPADAPKAAAPARKPRARLKPKPIAESNTNKENGVRTDSDSEIKSQLQEKKRKTVFLVRKKRKSFLITKLVMLWQLLCRKIQNQYRRLRLFQEQWVHWVTPCRFLKKKNI